MSEITRALTASVSVAALALVAGASPNPARAAPAADPLKEGFRSPPASARPRVWWHWMNGNVTKDGIAKDLAWMKRIGIGGVQNFDASLNTPQIVDRRLVYMTPEWKDAFRFAVAEADRLGLEFAIAASPGWSETGGPWVKPGEGMKKLVWSETVVAGGKRTSGPLAAAPGETGPYQDIAFHDPLAFGPAGKAPPRAAADVAVVAVRADAAALPVPAFSLATGAAFDGAKALDGSYATTAAVPIDEKLAGELRLAYPRPVTVRSAQAFLPGLKKPFRNAPVVPVLEARLPDGWRELARFEATEVPGSVGFPEVTAQEFRLRFIPNPSGTGGDLDAPVEGAEAFDIFAIGKLTSVDLAELRLSGEMRLNRAEEKAGFGTVLDYGKVDASHLAGKAVRPVEIIDLTSRLRPDGTLDWVAPVGGSWRVYRFGWSLTGKTNHPATPEATGLEVDKLDGAAVERYLETYLSMYRDTLGATDTGMGGLDALLTDSIEVGAANWTPAMEREFARRRGYALRPWLPALAGVVIGSAAETERFLGDFRRTQAELIAENHYGTVARVARRHGLKVYGEALENGRPSLGDDLAMRAHADVPMAALWTWSREGQPRWSLIGDMKGAASVAHVYGKMQVAAESMTSANAPWAFAPRDLKRIIDFEFVNGINLPVIHTSVHVPVDDRKPGLSLMIFGQHFNRNESWAEMAGPWIDYMSRSAYLLQQGRNVADVAVFYGEDSPLTAMFAGGIPADLPRTYAYDFVNADMLASALKASNGELVSTGGARYRALQLAGTSATMTMATLRTIAQLADAGVTVIGAKPKQAAALTDNPAQFAALADRIWSLANVGDAPLERALATRSIGTDFAFAGKIVDADIRYVHRQTADSDIYFVNNRRNRVESGEARFRVAGKRPELWDALTGTSRGLGYRVEGTTTVVPLDLGPEDAKFVVFRETVSDDAATPPLAAPQTLATVPGPWTVEFESGRGAPASITLGALRPLSEHQDPGVRYFSGIATYRTSFAWGQRSPAKALWLDLGEVGDIGEVRVNGVLAGTTWFAPDRVRVSGLLRPGRNTIEVRVANRWINRLIGDKQDGAAKATFTAAPTYRKDAPLRRSGLIGPVTIGTGE